MTPEQQIARLEKELAECREKCGELKFRNESLLLLVGDLKKLVEGDINNTEKKEEFIDVI